MPHYSLNVQFCLWAQELSLQFVFQLNNEFWYTHHQKWQAEWVIYHRWYWAFWVAQLLRHSFFYGDHFFIRSGIFGFIQSIVRIVLTKIPQIVELNFLIYCIFCSPVAIILRVGFLTSTFFLHNFEKSIDARQILHCLSRATRFFVSGGPSKITILTVRLRRAGIWFWQWRSLIANLLVNNLFLWAWMCRWFLIPNLILIFSFSAFRGSTFLLKVRHFFSGFRDFPWFPILIAIYCERCVCLKCFYGDRWLLPV